MVGGSLPELRQEGAQPEVGRKKACACTQKGGRPGRGQDLSKRSPTDAGQQAPGPCLHASGTSGGDRLIVRSNSPERRPRGGMRRDADGPVWIAPRQTKDGASEDAAGAKEAQFLRACRIRSYYIRIVKLKIVTLIAITEDGELCEGSAKTAWYSRPHRHLLPAGKAILQRTGLLPQGARVQHSSFAGGLL